MDVDIFSRTLQAFLEQTLLFLPRLVVALVIFFIALYIAGLLAGLVKRALQLRDADPELTLLLARITRWAAIILGTIWALGQVNFDITGFVAGLGIVGFTLGFALQDIAKNFVAGVLLLLQQPFDIGNGIEVAGYGGTVTNIEVRATTIRTWDGVTVIIPNADVYTSAITKYAGATRRRVDLSVGVGYQSDLEHVTRTLTDTLLALPGVIQDDPAPAILFDEFGDSAISLTARFWTDTGQVDPLTAKTNALKAVKQACQREGIDIPYPIVTVLQPG